jgi:type-F conjugative transfer system secretin TraK
VALISHAKLEAAQTFKVKDGDTVSIDISARELTRIAVSGKGRLSNVWGPDGILEIQADKSAGEVFIRPLAGAPAVMSFFAKDDMGATYTIIAKQKDIPSETVILQPSMSGVKKGEGLGSNKFSSTPVVEQIKKLIRSMATGKGLDGLSYEEFDEEIELWSETNIKFVQRFESHGLWGEVYLIKNVSDKELVFNEQEFLDFGKNVKAVALEHLKVQAGQTTTLYVVRLGEGVE